MPRLKQDATRKQPIKKHASFLESLYPNTAYFAQAIGWIEIGYDVDSPRSSFVIALDPGGVVWEGRDKYRSLDAAFRDLEEGLGAWMREMGIESRSA